MVILPFSFIYFQAYDSGRVVLLFTFIWLKQDLSWEFLNKRGRSDNHLSQLDNKERHCDSKVFCQRTRPNDSDQGQDPDLLTPTTIPEKINLYCKSEMTTKLV